jgi:hypothetical protein
MSDNAYDKLNKIINSFMIYLDNLNKEVDLNEHVLDIHYDYDIVPLPDDIIDEANKNDK